MNLSLLRKWIKALRSGIYQQTRKRLKSIDNKYCCLGVLCDISGLHEWTDVGQYNLDAEMPPKDVKQLLDENFDYHKLARMNDKDGKSFEEIANYLETYDQTKTKAKKPEPLWKYLAKLGACNDAIHWSKNPRFKTDFAAWRSCPNYQWLLFILENHYSHDELKPLIKALDDCYESLCVRKELTFDERQSIYKDEARRIIFLHYFEPPKRKSTSGR